MTVEKSKSQNHLIIGLPGTGKTTFLAALWHVVSSNEVEGALRLVRLEGNRKHLNAIRKAWLEFREVGRTNRSSEEIVAMRLRFPNGPEAAQIIFPDMSGESFRRQWVKRKWSKDYSELVQEATGIVLFAHPRKVVPPQRLDPSIEEAVEILANDDVVDDVSDNQQDTRISEWDPKNAPTQVQLVELLQFIDKQRRDSNAIPVAVIISAWDLAVHDYESPDQWLLQRLPLLDQYLTTNAHRYPSRVYGVSAQGAPLDGDLTILQAHENQSERILIQGAGCISHDITCPVRWIVERYKD